jgi:hypothetical protein
MNTLLGAQTQLVIVGQVGTPSRRDVSVSFTPPLKEPIPKGEVEAEIIRSNSKGEATVRFKDGREAQAKITPPLPEGTALKIRITHAGAQAKTVRFELPTSNVPAKTEGTPQQSAAAQQTQTSSTASKAPPIPLESLKTMLTNTHTAAPVQKGAPLTLPSTAAEVKVTGHTPANSQGGAAQLILTLVSSTSRQTQDFTVSLPQKLPIGTTLTIKPSANTIAAPAAGKPVQVSIESISLKPESLPQAKVPAPPSAGATPLPPRSIPVSQTQFTKPLEQLILQKLAAQPDVEQTQVKQPLKEAPTLRLYPLQNAPVKMMLNPQKILQFETPVSLEKSAEQAPLSSKEIPAFRTPAPLPVDGHARVSFQTAPTLKAPTDLPPLNQVIFISGPTAQASQKGQQVATVQSQMGEGFYSIKIDSRPPLIVQAPSQTPLPVGTKLVLASKPDGTTVITQTILPQLTPGAQVQEALGQKWDGLFKALETLYQRGHDAEGTKLYDSLPRMGEGFIGPFLSFAEAVSKNDISRFIDKDTVNILRALGIDLSADTSQLNMAARPDNSGDNNWRSLIFPFLENYGDTPDQGHFFWKREKGDKGKAPTSQFVFRFGLSEMGPVHLDGRVDGKTLTLNMKLEKPIDKQFEQGLRKLVENVGSGYGYDAKIDIQVLEELPPLPVIGAELQDSNHYNMNV